MDKSKKEHFTDPELNLGSKSLGNEIAIKVAKKLRSNNIVQKCDLRNNNIGDPAAKELAQMLLANSTIHTLSLADNTIGDMGVTAISQSLLTNTTLTKLDLRYNNIGKEGAMSIAQMLQANTTLTKLDLQLNNVSSLGASYLAQILSVNYSLAVLVLSNNNIGNEGAIHFAKALPQNSTLQGLYLANNNIGNEGAKALARALFNNSTITKVDLSRNNQMTNESVGYFETVLERNTTLVKLVLGPGRESPALEAALERNYQRSNPNSIRTNPPTKPMESKPLESLLPFTDRSLREGYESSGVSSFNSQLDSSSERSGDSGSDSHESSLNRMRAPRVSQKWSEPTADVAWQTMEEPKSSPTAAPPSLFHVGIDDTAHKLVASSETEQQKMQDGEKLSQNYNTTGRISERTRLTDYFYDIPIGMNWVPLSKIQSQSAILPRKPSVGCMSPEENDVIIVNQHNDPILARCLRRAKKMIGHIFDISTKVKFLAVFVSNCFGGSTSSIKQLHANNVAEIKKERNNNALPIGCIQYGLSRHRAILFKYLCDFLRVPCSLHRGRDSREPMTWNLVHYGVHKECVVDLMFEAGSLYPADSPKAQDYIKYGKISRDLHMSVIGDNSIMGLGDEEDEVTNNRYFCLPDSTCDLVKHGKLGGGSAASVYRASMGGVTFAVKRVHAVHDYQKAIQEIVILEQLHHANIVKYLGHELVGEGELHIFMEYIPFSLNTLMKQRKLAGQSFRDDEMKYIALEVIKGLHYLHFKATTQILHRDLKSKNILIDVDQDEEIRDVKLCDFGVSKMLSENAHAATLVGTYYWMAPEILANEQRPYTFAADIWSYGMVLVELTTLANPYSENGNDWGKTKQMITRGQPPKIPSSTPSLIRTIISDCLQLNPSSRPTSQDVMVQLIAH